MRRKRSGMAKLILAVLALLASPAAVQAATPPKLGLRSFDQLPQPLPLPYDERMDADKLVDAARQQAKRSGKLLLLDLGANWCPSCRMLAGTLKLAPLRRFVARHFVVVTIDVGRFDNNMHIPAFYGVDQLAALPSLLMIDPQHDELINEGEVSIFAHLKHHNPQAVADWLAQWPREIPAQRAARAVKGSRK